MRYSAYGRWFRGNMVVRLAKLAVFWVLLTVSSYWVLGLFLVEQGFIACVWPIYELLASVLGVPVKSVVVQCATFAFFSVLWFVFVLGIKRGKSAMVAIPFGILLITVATGLVWGHAFAFVD